MYKRRRYSPGDRLGVAVVFNLKGEGVKGRDALLIGVMEPLDGLASKKHLDLLVPPDPANKADKGQKILAIYELDGDDLRICYRMPAPTAKDPTVTERPTQFGSTRGGTLLRLQRAK